MVVLAILRSSDRKRYQEGLKATLALNQKTFALYDDLKAAGVRFEMHNSGLVFAARNERTTREYAEMFGEIDQLGFTSNTRVLGPEELRELEPALSNSVVGGLFASEERYVQPETLTRGLVAYLRTKNVDIIEGARVETLHRDNRQAVWKVTAGSAQLISDHVVIAAGVWTKFIAANLGIRIPLEAAKGYSLTTVGEGTRPQHALYLAEAKVGCIPTEITSDWLERLSWRGSMKR